MTIEVWMQDSPIKGLRAQKFEVDEKDRLLWIEEDGSRTFRYGRAELQIHGWVKMDQKQE